jgi:hypothetical protein
MELTAVFQSVRKVYPATDHYTTLSLATLVSHSASPAMSQTKQEKRAENALRREGKKGTKRTST